MIVGWNTFTRYLVYQVFEVPFTQYFNIYFDVKSIVSRAQARRIVQSVSVLSHSGTDAIFLKKSFRFKVSA